MTRLLNAPRNAGMFKMKVEVLTQEDKDELHEENEAHDESTSEFKHVWAAIEELREAVYNLNEMVGIETPAWVELIPFFKEDTPAPKTEGQPLIDT
jgi:hypothetical protein